MKPRSGILVGISVVLGLLLFQSLPAHGASLSLSIPNGRAGSTVTATLGFADAAEVASFTAILYYPSEPSEDAFFTAGSFTPNTVFLPSEPIGEENANFSIPPSGGAFCVAGLKPSTTTGAVTIGTLPFTVSENAEVGEERVVTLTGEIYTEDGTVEQLPPVSILFTVADPQDPDLPTVTTAAVTDITLTTAKSGGIVASDGGAEVTARGVCWSTSLNPTTAHSKTTDGPGTGGFVSNLTGLNSGTPYYVRAYATNSEGTAYGENVYFTATPTDPDLPTIGTAAVIEITPTTAKSGGNVGDEGGAPVTVRGVCWSTSPNPTTASSKTTDGPGTGGFVSNLTGLNSGTPYYVRAYATNSLGTAYGNEVSFATTASIPTVATTAVTSITKTTAVSGGNVTADGGAPVTARGVCWSTSPNPTTASSKTTDGPGTGGFVSNLTGLNSGTPYYVRAYATNSFGTAYGNEVSFTTTSTSSTLYVSNDGQCGGLLPCYATLQAALDVAADGDTIQAANSLAPEAPIWAKTGTVTISGGWKPDFSGQDGMTSMYAPKATGGGGVKVQPDVKIIPKP